MAANESQIVIRRVKKVVGGGHHGGAWKVAFADFVTAMMAFFLVLWLVGAASPKEKAAISEYFNDPNGGDGPALITHGGIGPGGASTSMIERGGTMDPAQTMNPTHPDAATAEEIAQAMDRQRLEQLREELEQAISQSQALAPFKDQLLLDITDEGLRIQIVDKLGRPMFDSGSSSLKDYTRLILRELAPFISKVDNGISIGGHTDNTPYSSREGYSNWELSAERANAARRSLVAAGLDEQKLVKVVGLSASVPFDRADPSNPMNRRISIVVMNRKAEQAVRREGEMNNVDAEPAGAPVSEPVTESSAESSAKPAPIAVAATTPAAASGSNQLDQLSQALGEAGVAVSPSH